MDRVTISISAMPCSTPKLIQLLGNISQEPIDTSTAQAATWAQRRQKFREPASIATACDRPAQNRNSETMAVRCPVHSGSV